MLKNLFNKGKKEAEQKMSAPAAPAAIAPTPMRAKKPTRKKKNTYVVHLNTFTTPGMHELCANTPLVVIKTNGVPAQDMNTVWATGTEFPNPGASQIEVLYRRAPEWRIIMGEKMTQTIIEYLDKETLKPVLMVYPNGYVHSLVQNMDANTVIGQRLNHASRRDFVHQYNRILEMVRIVNPLIDARNRAMERAPLHSPEAYAKYVVELDRTQIERARQIAAQRQK